MVEFQFLAHFAVDLLSYPGIYSFCATLWHSVILWLIILSLPLHNLNFLFYLLLSTFPTIPFVLMALFSAVIRGNEVSLLSFLFRNHVHDVPCDILPLCRMKYLHICFSSHFTFQSFVVLFFFLLLLLLATIISPFLLCLSNPQALVLMHPCNL